MEFDSQEPEVMLIEQKSRLHQVTPLSKCLAMVLFIILPFLGGWVGYNYAPDKVEKVEVVTEKITEVVEVSKKYSEPRYGTFLSVDPSKYNLDGFVFQPSTNRSPAPTDDLFARTARKLSEELVILTIEEQRLVEQDLGMSEPYATVLYNINKNQVIQQIDYPWFKISEWFGLNIHIYIDENWGEPSRVVLHDYINDNEVILYTESDQDVQLLDVCEIGCKGLLYITTDGRVVFGRHQKIKGTTATQLLEVVSVSIPEEYFSDSQRVYRDGQLIVKERT